MKRFAILTLLLMFVCPQISFAATESAQFPSPGCDKSKIRSLGGKAITKIHGPIQGNKYLITLDTEKMSFSDLMDKLHEANCFKAKAS